ncbi:hypothetical protein Pelo_16938 [Pelomyxa schiedti]|nr:hypothetical protein Pelo_16938 [Pelomyxa schiedti]
MKAGCANAEGSVVLAIMPPHPTMTASLAQAAVRDSAKLQNNPPHSYIAHEEITEAMLKKEEMTCSNHHNVSPAEVAPGDFFNPPSILNGRNRTGESEPTNMFTEGRNEAQHAPDTHHSTQQEGAVPDEAFPMCLRERILRDVAMGLAHLHRQCPPVTHGDLHAGNILITSLDATGSGPLAKVTCRMIPADYNTQRNGILPTKAYFGSDPGSHN